jgi:putative aldouronate transport system substrate-binding protein
MKKLFVVFVCLALTIPLFAGGQGAGAAGSGAAPGKTSRVGAKGSLPLATNKPVLTMLYSGGYTETTTSFEYKDNVFTRQVVDETGIQLQIISTAPADAREQLNILLNTGEYPDIIFSPYGGVDLEYYAAQGIIIPLDAYEPLSYPNIQRVFTEYPEVSQRITATDGKIYAMPSVLECLHCTYQTGRIWYYMPWIRDNGRKVPETLDEFTDFLRYVKNTDLNKNGKKDEIGIAFSSGDVGGFVARIAKAYMPFVAGSYFGLALDNNKKIVEQYRDPAFRETLRYIAGLYKEGLILEDSFSMTADQLAAIARNTEPLAAILGTPWLNNFTEQLSQRFMDYFYLPALQGPQGQRWGTNAEPWGTVNGTYFITDKCKDPELAVALYDYFSGPAKNSAVGPKGVFWGDPDPGAVGKEGEPATYKVLLSFGNEPVNSGWHDGSPGVASKDSVVQVDGGAEAIRYMATGDKNLGAQLATNASYPETMWYRSSVNESKYALPMSIFIPPQNISGADSDRVADINAVLNPYLSQVIVEFITGVRDINNNSHWTAYLAELDRLGSPEMVSIRQKYVR